MITEILHDVASKGIHLYLKDARLAFKAPKDALTSELQKKISENKNEIIEFLKNQNISHIDKRIQKFSGESRDFLLSFPQQRLWLLDQIDGGSAHYNIPAALRLVGNLNEAAAQQAFTTILERHESLRTCFVAGNDGQPRQVIQPAAEFVVPLIDLTEMDEHLRQGRLTQCIADEAHRVFDLSCDLMLRAQLIKIATDEHIVLVTMHHIASDGWSMSILINEFSALYSAYVQGLENPLPPLTIQYADYAQWQRNWLQGEVLKQQLGYWEKQLAALPVVHSLPLDYPRPAVQGFSGKTVKTTINAHARKTLTALCHAQGATLFMGLHAAFSVLLARYSNEKDIVVGSPIANREQAEIAGLIGFFVNTLVLRSDLSQNPDFISLLDQSKSMLLDAYAHQQVPFEQIVERLQPERSLSHSALFQVMLVLQNNEQGILELPELSLSPVGQSADVAKFDLTLNVFESEQGLNLECEYNTDLFTHDTITRMATHFAILLNALIAAPHENVFKVEMLSAQERQQLLIDWNNTQVDYPKDKCIHELFEAQVENNPDAIAVIFENQQLTYAELNQNANQLAHYLIQEKNLKPDTLVGICVERSLEMVVGILAILKAGGAYVPLDPEYPEARLKYMLDDARLGTVLTQCHLRETTPVTDQQALCLDDEKFQQQLQTHSINNPDTKQLGLTSGHLAYVIYTSGSTGNPKGSLLKHTSLCNLALAQIEKFCVTPASRVLQFASIAFDAATSELFMALGQGAAVILLTNQAVKSPTTISTIVEQNYITHATLPPVLLPLLNISQWHSVQTLVVAGDACSQHLAKKWSKDRLFINAYGPSEITVCATVGFYTQDQSVLHIGKPIHNIQTYVLNEQLKLTSQGIVGELHIGGVGLAREYLNRPGLTTEKFIPNPFYDKNNTSSSERLYKTGDLVRWLPDGNLEFLGRIDHQVKIRGFRIELGEIENALWSYATVKDAIVITKEFNADDKRLVAYVVTDVKTSVNSVENSSDVISHHETIESLREHLSQSLPDYMVPNAFVLLDQLPLTPNGKVDRKALPEPDFSARQNIYVAPRTETEKLLCEIWKDVLGVERISIHDNFFQLGGHSLLIMQMIPRLQTRGLSMAARQLFTTPTLCDLAKVLEKNQSNHSLYKAPANFIPANCAYITPEMLPLVNLSQEEILHIAAQVSGGAENVQDIYRLAPLQEGILFHHMMNDKVDPYVMTMLFSIDSAKAVADFIEALQFMVDRHDVLRTAVYWQGLSVPVQVVYRQASLPVQWLELGEHDVKAQMLTRCEPGQQWIDLRQAPLVQLQIAIEPESKKHFVLLQLHHIVSDHVGLEIIQQEVALYQLGLANTLADPLPYREFVAHAHHQSLNSDAEIYFKHMLGDLEETTALFDMIDVNGDGSQVVELKASIPDNISSRIRALSKDLQLSPAILFHVAWGMVVASCSGRDDVVFGTVLSGRLQGTVGADTMLGMFINTLPVRMKLGQTSVVEVIRQVQDSLLNLLTYEQASLALAQRCSGLVKGSPLFTSMLNYRYSVVQDNESNHSGYEVIDGHERTNYPFNLSVDDLGEAFSLELQIDKLVSAERILGYMQTAIVSLVDALQYAPQEAINRLSILPDSERRQLLIDWNKTQADYPKDKCIHKLFEAQAENNPNAVAVAFENQQLTYRELNQKANQLAHYLIQEKNLKPDTLVGICVERSLDMVVGILAILKAGGAYVPLDPEYPEARLKYMLDDAKLSTVLTQRHLREITPVTDQQALCLDDEKLQQRLQTYLISNPDPQKLGLTPLHLAYVIYTSGSTGNPKGVMIHHESLVNLVGALRDSYGLTNADSMLQFAPMSFDMSVEEIFGALCSGCKLVLRTEFWLESVNKFWQHCTLNKITILNLPTAFWHELAKDKYAARATSVRHISIGGEKINELAIKNWFDRNSTSPALLNAYGPTECTVNASFAEINMECRNSIGKALNNTQLLVMDSSGSLSPVGVSGELHLGGVGLARGYLNRPDLTVEKFISNPFYDKTNSSSSERLYKTGDLVRWLPDGNLEFLGRIDHQVKIRGFRIELGEIENALSTYASVKDAIVLTKESTTIADKRLIAYVVTDAIAIQDDSEQATISRQELIEQLRHHVSQSLPDYMVPSAIVLLNSLPLTPNGKVDRKALPDVDMSAQQNMYAAPRTEIEKILCHIWQEVLGIERVGITDNFFNLGGHSLLIMQVISRLQQQGLSVTARQLFTTPLVMDLANVLEVNTADALSEFKAPPNLIPREYEFITSDMLTLVSLSDKEIASIVEKIPGGAGNIQDIYPLGPLQEGILFHHMMSTQGDPYIMPSLYKVKGLQAVNDFISALQFIINRHDVLRTAIFWNELSTPVQVVCHAARLPVIWLDLGAEKNIESVMRARCIPEQQWMDLGQAPLLNLQIAADAYSQEYFVLLQYHHIISDHVGLDIIQKELTLYQQGLGDTLPAPVAYREFVAHAQHQALHNDAEAFFKNTLGDIDEPTAPFNLLEVNGDGSRIVEIREKVPTETSCNIRRLAKQLSVSPAAIFHSAWAMVVAQCSGRDDVVFGTLLSGRLQGTLGAENMLGVFINTLPFRVTLKDISVITLIRQVQNSLLELLPYEQTSLASAQNCSGLPKGAPLFSALLNYRHSLPEDNQAAKDVYNSQEIYTAKQAEYESKFEFISGQERTNYPFNLSVDDFGHDFSLDVQVDNSVSAERVLGYIQTAITELVKALEFTPHKTVNALSILPEMEHQQLIIDWNNTQTDYPKDKCIHELFEAQVEHHPNAIAVIFENQQLTYRELNQQANQLAHYLIHEKHIKPDTLVGICVERSLEMVIGILAILKAGGAYVPLDPEYPEARLQYMLDDANLTTVLTQTHLRKTTPVSDLQALCLDDEKLQQQLQTHSINNPDTKQLGLTSNHLAYVIYTSGSTGNPKGVMVEHHALVNRVDWMNREYGSSPSDRILQKTPFSFDVSVWEFVWPLSVGAGIVLAKPEGHKDPIYLSTLIRDQQITKLHFVPSMLGSMLTLGNFSQCTSLQQVFCSGEALALHHVKDFQTICPWAELHNLYGPTEAAIDVSYWNCSQSLLGLTSVPIGRPISNIQLFVLNQELNPVPEQVAGELHIGGVGLARGYLNRADLTSEKFIVNPFYDKTNPASSKRLYKTGDLVRWLPDGNLEFLGRLDHQVKIRGFRIELGEIENALIAHADVKDVIVLVKESVMRGDKRLVAYVMTDAASLQNNSETGVAARSGLIENLRQHLNQTLPDYMVPSAFVLLTQLPLSPNGKVDRKALPEPDVSGQQNIYVAPRTETEKILCEVWQEVLGVERVGITDNFFELGGHSLLVMQVISHLQQQGLAMAARQLFTMPSLADLANVLDSAITGTVPGMFKAPANIIPEDCEHITPEMLPLVNLSAEEIANITNKIPGGAKNIQDIYPLAPMQEGILFHHMMSDQSDPYVMPMLFKIEGSKIVTEFIDALQFVIDRNDVLRTAFFWDELSVPVQVVCRQASLPINWLTFDTTQDIEAEMYARCAPEQQWINLGQAPLLQMYIAGDLTSEHYFVLLQIHHLIDDVTSLRILQTEIESYFIGQVENLTIRPLYREFVAHALNQVKQNDAARFFSHMLGDVEESTTPFNLSGVLGDGSRAVVVRSKVPDVIAHQLRQAAKAVLISPATLFHTAWALIISSCSGRNDVVFGTVMSGRLQGIPGAESMVGMFINTLPLRVKLHNINVIDVVRQIQHSLLDLLQYEQASLAFAQRCSSLPTGAPLFSALLNYRHSESNDNVGNDDERSNAKFEILAMSERTNYPFTLAVDDFGHDFELEVQVDSSVDAERVLAYVQTALAEIVKALKEKPHQLVEQLTILPAAERQRLLVDWNNTQTNYPKEKCIHELFEAQVKHTPDAIAVMFENQQLTYLELNQKANQLAHYLIQEKYVKPDTLVGICVERSLEMVMGILAILKAGGAYVPLDPEYPWARLKYMLDDANLSTVLTQRHLRETTPVSDAQAICLDDEKFQQQLHKYSTENPNTKQSGLTSNHLAYVIYTSGSTGNPKGVMVEHRNVVNFLTGMRSKPGIKIDDCLLAVTSTSFDIHGLELFLPLTVGAKLVVVEKDATGNPESLFSLLKQHHVSLMQATPATWKMLLDANWQADSPLKILCGGEALNVHLATALLSNPSIELWNMYGPTETTIWSTTQQISPQSDQIMMGQPIANTQVYVVSKTMELAPVGVAGELLIGGAGVTRGYLNRADLTAEKFIFNPFYDKNNSISDSSGRLYKTGDLVRRLSNGDLEFLGRIDHQVKIRGFRIELGEIENTLIAHTNVKDAIVLAKDAIATADKFLVAYVVVDVIDAQDENELSITAHHELIENLGLYLGKTLPAYMVPSVFVLLAQLPLTPNGKVNRKALPEPDMAAQQEIYIAPRTANEKTIAKIWSVLFAIPVGEISIDSNFFRIGGDSLSAVKFKSIANREGLNFSLRDIISLQTIRELAAISIIENENCIESNGVNANTYAHSDNEFPLLPEQQWFFSENYESPEHFNIAEIIPLEFELDYEKTKKTLSNLIAIHDVLSCGFTKRNGKIVTTLAQRAPFELLHFFDLSAMDENDQEFKIEKICTSQQKLFSVENGPLFCLAYFYLGNGKKPLLFYAFNHLICDATSLEIFVNDFQNIYFASLQDDESISPQRTYSLAGIVKTIENIVFDERYNQRISYWKAQPFTQYKKYETDYVCNSSDNIVSSARSYEGTLGKAETQMLVDFAVKRLGFSLIDIIYYATANALTLVNKGNCIPIWHIASGRPFIEMNSTINMDQAMGWFSMPSPRFIKINKNGDTLKNIQEMVNLFKQIPDGGCSYLPLYYSNDTHGHGVPFFPDEDKVVLNHLGSRNGEAAVATAPDITMPENPRNYRSCLFKCSTEIVNGELKIFWGYSKNQYDSETIEKLVNAFLTQLRIICLESQSSEKSYV